jgi:hypothetical protein
VSFEASIFLIISHAILVAALALLRLINIKISIEFGYFRISELTYYYLIIISFVVLFWIYVWKLRDGYRVVKWHIFFHAMSLMMLCIFPMILGIVITNVSASFILGVSTGLLIYVVQRILYQPAFLNLRCQPKPTTTSLLLRKIRD